MTERVVVKIVFDVTANLIETNPVDTGWSRANWLPSVGQPIEDDLSGIRPTPADAAASTVVQQAGLATVVATYNVAAGPAFITNNVPYILGLNDGTSKQQPRGFVQRAIRKALTGDVRGFKG